MLATRTILCPIDFSDCSRRAFEVATALAKWTSARVVVLHVGGTVTLYPAVVVGVSGTEVPHPTRAERALSVARFIANASDPHRPANVVLAEGDVASTITAEAEAQGADLIVMGTHGQRGFRRLVIGSIAQHVAYTAPCPVLVVPPSPWPLPSFRGFQRILCRESAIDLASARAFAEVPDSHVEAVPAGATSRQILDTIQAAEPDLIVWNRQSGTLADILRRSPAPVLIVDTLPVFRTTGEMAPRTHRER